MPELTRGFVDVVVNKNWRDKHIHKPIEYQTGPNSASGFPDTPAAYKEAAQILNKFTGGTRGRSGWLDLYPEDIAYLAKEYFGGQVRLAENIAKAVTGGPKGKGVGPADIPVAKVVYGTDYDRADQTAARERQFHGKHQWLGPAEHAQAPWVNVFGLPQAKPRPPVTAR
jgi:hypothetical protein